MIKGRYWQHQEIQRKRENREALIKLCWVVAPVLVLMVALCLR